VTITTIPQIFDVAQDGEDVDGAVIVSSSVNAISKIAPKFDSQERTQVRALCRVLDAAYEFGRTSGVFLVDDSRLIAMINAAIEGGIASKGRRA
jgi:hypothetical protein